jgi:hypothetical protein
LAHGTAICAQARSPWISKHPFLFLPNFHLPRGARTHFHGEIQSGGVSLTKLELFTNKILMLTNRASVALKRLCAKHRAFPKGKGRKHEYNADSVLRKQFSGDLVSAKPRLISDFASGGGGVWGGILRLLHPFSFGEIRGGHYPITLYGNLE